MKFEGHLRGVPNLERDHSTYCATVEAVEAWAKAVLSGGRVPEASKFAAYVEVVEVEKRVIAKVFNATAGGVEHVQVLQEFVPPTQQLHSPRADRSVSAPQAVAPAPLFSRTPRA